MHKSCYKVIPYDDKRTGLDNIVYALLQLPIINVAPLAEALLIRAETLGRIGYIDFDGEKWAGWRINGCGQIARGDLILGYYMNPGLTHLPHFPEAEEIIDMIPGIKHAVRLFKLSAGVRVGLHHDNGEFYLERTWQEVRKIHIPLITNEYCRHLYEDANGQINSVEMKPGQAWYLNGTFRHGAENLGDTDRWHLVIDVDPSPDLHVLLGKIN